MKRTKKPHTEDNNERTHHYRKKPKAEEIRKLFHNPFGDPFGEEF